MLQKLIAPLALLINKSLLTLVMLISFIHVNSQITINTPTLGFSEVCASTTFNSFNLSFSFSPASNLGSGNVFSVELSNSSGSFASPTVLTTSSETTSPINVSFPFPTNVSGTGYRIRVKSSAPVSTSPTTSAFSANYAPYNQPFTINNNVSNQTICGSSSYNLTIDSGPNSPLNFSQLTYRWFKDNIVITGQTSSSLPILQAGDYRVEVNYGTCNMNSYSNIVTIAVAAAETLTINSQGNATSICPSTGLLLSSTIASSGYTYQWYKDTVLIAGATGATYSATQAGSYSLEATNSVCTVSSNVLVLTENSFTLSLDSGTEINLLPGQSKTLTCTTNALSPTYIWYRNNIVLSGQTASTLSVNQTGTYKVRVTQSSGCTIFKEVSTLVTAPSSYNLVISHSASYVDCDNLTETLTIDSFDAVSSLGTTSIPSNIGVGYRWFKNNVEIVGASSSSYMVANYMENDTYHAKAKFTDGQEVSSNNLDVKLKIDETINLTTDGVLCTIGSVVTITSSVTNSIFTYQWFKDGETTVLGTNTSYDATEVGDYYLTISFMGCDLSSNLISVETIDESLLITNYDEEIFINEGEEITITASGADSYEWIIIGNTDAPSNTTNQITISEEGEVQLLALINGCEIVRNFIISFQPQFFNTVIPNTITPNNDGKNDTWIITEDFAYKNNVEIVIFSSNQQIVYRTKDYQNNWPLEPISKNNKLFYYKIIRDNSTVLQGTISVIQ